MSSINTQKCSTSACNYILNLDVVRCVCNLLYYDISHTVSWQNVNTVTRLWTGWSKVWSLAEVRDQSLFQTAQNGSGTHVAS